MTTTEEVIRLAREMADTVCNEIGPVAMCKDPLSFAQEVGVRLIDLVRAEENEACAKVCEDRVGTMSMFATTRDTKTHNAAVKGDAAAIRARRTA